jgi:hypothetical protein
MAIGGNKNRKDLIDGEGDALFAGVEAALKGTSNHDSVIAAHLSKVIFDPLNGRFGQTELVNNLEAIESCIAKYIADTGEDTVPDYDKLSASTPAPTLSVSAKKLFNNCASLANTFIPNGGVADQPPKVTPANANGFHGLKTGHRRTIAYHLARPITGVTSIDILIDKSKSATETLYQQIGRIAENTSRVNNSLAEEIHMISMVLKLINESGNELNRVKLAQSTGIERTKLGKIVDVINSGFDQEVELITKLHESGTEDVKALSQLVKYPKAQWPELVQNLIEKGSSWFRNEHKELKVISSPQDKNSAGISPALLNIDTTVLGTGATNTGTGAVVKTESTPATKPPPTSATPTEVKAPINTVAKNENTTHNEQENVSKPFVNIRERGAKEILKLLNQIDTSIQINESESALDALERLISKYGVNE